MSFAKQTCVLIGGASDLATATGIQLDAAGAKVILVHHNQQSLDRVLPSYPEPGKIESHIADICDYGQLEQVIQTIVGQHQRIDIMINCAGILDPKPIDEMSLELWHKVLDVNLNGAFYACKAVTPIMKKQQYGRIINITSLAGRTGRPGVGVNYGASKAGMIGLTQTLARELAPWNITVNAVAPGPLMGRMFYSLSPEASNKLESTIPMGRVGEMREVTSAILYLASVDAGWTTGEVIDVNGGAYI